MAKNKVYKEGILYPIKDIPEKYPEVSKKKSTVEDVTEQIPGWIPGVNLMKKRKKQLEDAIE